MTYTSSSPGTLGTIEWEITEPPDWRTVHRGRRTIRRDDVEIVRVADEHWPRDRPKPRSVRAFLFVWERVFRSRNLYRKRIHLEGGFYLEITESPVEESQRLSGFGFRAGHETTRTFSWEWFNVNRSREYAKKLQEGGNLRIGTTRGRSGWEVGYTEFLTDVSLRMRAEAEGGPLGSKRIEPEPRWRIRIVKGSHVTWPSADEYVEPPVPTFRPAVDETYPDPSEAPANIEWEITEAPDWRTVHGGSQAVERGDIEIVRAADERRTRAFRKPWLAYALFSLLARVVSLLVRLFDTRNRYRNRYTKRIHLGGGFYLDLHENVVEEREHYYSFSLSVRHETTATDSSHSFFVDYRGRATHQGGKLRVGLRRGRSGWEVAYTEFLTDISLRAWAALDEGDRFWDKWTLGNTRWRVRIAEGSRVYWPSVDEIAGPAPN